MGAQHIQILNLQRPTARLQIEVDLAVIVEAEHARLGQLLTAEVVRLELDVGGEFGRGGARVGLDRVGARGFAAGAGGGRGRGAEEGGEGLEEGFVEARDGGGEEGGGVVCVDGGVEAVGDCWGLAG